MHWGNWSLRWRYMRFFMYGMDGFGVLLQMPASTHGLTSLAKIIGIWQSMLPVCLRIGGFNVCSPGILLVLDVWAVHETPGSQNLMHTADMRILDVGEMRHWSLSLRFACRKGSPLSGANQDEKYEIINNLWDEFAYCVQNLMNSSASLHHPPVSVCAPMLQSRKLFKFGRPTANGNQYPELHFWNRLQTTYNPTICDPLPSPVPW